MDAKDIIKELKATLELIDSLKEEKRCIASIAVKSWKKKVEDAMDAAGSHGAKNLQAFRALKFGAPAKAIPIGKKLEDFVQYNNFLMELEASKKLIASSIQTLSIFGKPGEDAFADWRKKEVPKAVGEITIGDKVVSVNSISLLELFVCFEKIIDDNKALSDEMKSHITDTLHKWRNNPVLSPLFSLSLDRVLGHLQD